MHIEEKIIRDPIHGYIHLSKTELAIINTTIFLRLRHIKQSPTAYFTYPAHHVDRFSHCLGTMELTGKVVNVILTKSRDVEVEGFLKECISCFSAVPEIQKEIQPERAKSLFLQVARLSGLLHDIGHLPFSHLGEGAVDLLRIYFMPMTLTGCHSRMGYLGNAPLCMSLQHSSF